MKNKLIAVDVDLTVVDSLTPWMNWIRQFSKEPVLNESKSYNLGPEIRDILDRAGYYDVDPLDFWKQHDLYDNMEPVLGSVSALRQAKGQGHDVIFVSSCFSEHTNSKVRMLDKWFPFHDGFIATNEKHFVAYDVMIDDKLEHLQLGVKYRPKAKHILFTGVREDGNEYARMAFTKMDRWNNLGGIMYSSLRSYEPAFA